MELRVHLNGIIMLGLTLSAFFSSPADALTIPMSWGHTIKGAEKTGANQLLLVQTRGAGATRAEVFCLESENGRWRIALRPFSGVVGRNGIAEPEKKKEGDGCSPFGIFPAGIAFGYNSTLETLMPYRQMKKNDIWVDDPSAVDYNRLVKIDETNAGSYEFMRREDDLYEAGLVVEYNTSPVIPGKGSAIFVHFWGRPFRPTSGCLGLTKKNLAAVLRFLDPDKKPAIAFIRKDLMIGE